MSIQYSLWVNVSAVVYMSLVSLLWSHELPVVSESDDSPLDSLNLMSPHWSHESPVVSLSLNSSHFSPLVSSSLSHSHESPLVSGVSSSLSESHEFPLVSISLSEYPVIYLSIMCLQ